MNDKQISIVFGSILIIEILVILSIIFGTINSFTYRV